MLFETQGFVICEDIIGLDRCNAVRQQLEMLDVGVTGSRSLLESSWCAELSLALRCHAEISALIPDSMVAVQCTLFEKSSDRNWLVGLHQDLSMPVAARYEHVDLNGWSQKDGAWFVQPPPAVVEQLVAVRLHLDDCGAEDGPLRVVIGTHREGRLSSKLAMRRRQEIGETACHVGIGGVLVMRPLLLHASSKSIRSSRRRVLHFVFGPKDLPYGLSWHMAIR